MGNKPRVGTRGTYSSPVDGEIGFEVVRVEGNLCWARYDNLPSVVDPFIWNHPDRLNNLHDWNGKTTEGGGLI